MVLEIRVSPTLAQEGRVVPPICGTTALAPTVDGREDGEDGQKELM